MSARGREVPYRTHVHCRPALARRLTQVMAAGLGAPGGTEGGGFRTAAELALAALRARRCGGRRGRRAGVPGSQHWAAAPPLKCSPACRRMRGGGGWRTRAHAALVHTCREALVGLLDAVLADPQVGR